MIKRFVLVVAIVALSLAATLALIRKPLLLAIGDFLVVPDALEAADVIHVISGPDDRTDHAIQLYKQSYAERIFFTGGWCTTHNYYHGQHGRERALAQELAPEVIVIDETPVTSTFDEVVRLQAFIEGSANPVRSVIAVSAPYHMRRARWTYLQVWGQSIPVQMAPVPFERSSYQREWWTDRSSRRHLKSEYLKLVYYYARYRLGWGPLDSCLASLDRD